MQFRHAFQRRAVAVAGLQRGDAGRGAHEDQVAGAQRVQLRELVQDVGDVPDQVVERALLAQFSVDFQAELARAQRADVGGRHDRADRRGVVEGLAGVPGQALGLGLGLQVAAGQVEADGVAVDQRLRILRRERAGRGVAAQRHHQFDLVVQVAGAGRVGHGLAGVERIGGLEEERRTAAIGGRGRRGRAHFAGVVGEVAA
ncbi:Tat pathway signal sequence domain protein, partial [Catenibacterium mitsuokai DSM 15897]